MPVTCDNDPQQANPEPDESLILPDTRRYGTVRVSAWRGVHPLIHGDRGYFAGWEGELPVQRGTVLRVTVEHLPDGRKPHKTMWLWHAGPAPLSADELWRAYLARFDEEHAAPHRTVLRTTYTRRRCRRSAVLVTVLLDVSLGVP